MPGRRPFTVRSNLRADAATVMAGLLRDVAPEMEARGYRITQRADGRLRFELEYRRGLLATAAPGGGDDRRRRGRPRHAGRRCRGRAAGGPPG